MFIVRPWPETEEIDPALTAASARRLNIGCGMFPLPFYTNLDADPETSYADRIASVPPIPYEDGTLDEIFAGHFIEHLTRPDAMAFVKECYRCLAPNGIIGLVAPDMREIMTRWLAGSPDYVECPPGVWHAVADLDDMCHLAVFSTIQPSHHLWAYDRFTLARLLRQAGFEITGEIDRYRDRRIARPAWYQVGVEGRKPAGGSSSS